MKKVLVIGANGRVGGKLVQALAAKKYAVLAGARNETKDTTTANVQFEAIDLLSDVDTLTLSVRDVDAIYFVAGSRVRIYCKLTRMELSKRCRRHSKPE